MSVLKLLCRSFLMATSLMAQLAEAFDGDITNRIPLIEIGDIEGYQKIPGVAQYKNSDWSHAVGMIRSVSLDAAKAIADSHADIAYFFYVKGAALCLENEDGTYRYFSRGDAVFFAGSPCWGTAVGYADGYIKLP